MKKFVCALLLACGLCLLAGCNNPSALQLDLSQGYGNRLKLLHLNANTDENRQRMEAFGEVVRNAEPLDKDPSMFAYYPDYLLEITSKEDGQSLVALIDLNEDHVDFLYPGPYPQQDQVVYRSHTSARDFKKLIHADTGSS